MKTNHICTPVLGLIAALLTPSALSARDPVILELQQKLEAANFDPKGVDGIWGSNTETALKAYQAANDLPQTGRLEPQSQTVSRLGITLPDTEEDLADLVRQGRVEAQTTGIGIQSISVSVRRKVPYPLHVRIPAGTFFVCGGGSAQNMVATSATSLVLGNDNRRTVSPDVACANLRRAIPDADNRFSVRSSPYKKDLAKLMPTVEQARVSFPVRQAAVWIITDNADYDDLGTLVTRRVGAGGSGRRTIDAADTARAMQLIEKAGLNLRGRRIWRDRRTIANGLGDGPLKQWLLKP